MSNSATRKILSFIFGSLYNKLVSLFCLGFLSLGFCFGFFLFSFRFLLLGFHFLLFLALLLIRTRTEIRRRRLAALLARENRA